MRSCILSAVPIGVVDIDDNFSLELLWYVCEKLSSRPEEVVTYMDARPSRDTTSPSAQPPPRLTP